MTEKVFLVVFNNKQAKTYVFLFLNSFSYLAHAVTIYLGNF